MTVFVLIMLIAEDCASDAADQSLSVEPVIVDGSEKQQQVIHGEVMVILPNA